MLKAILTIFIPLILVSCNVFANVPASAHTWAADISFVNFSDEQKEKVQSAISLLKKVIASKEFRDRVINYTYKGKRRFEDNGGNTNEEIYQMILDGAEEVGNTSSNNTLNVEIELYHDLTSTIGYTFPSKSRIWMNKKYFNNYTPYQVADNLMHEWMHKLGFSHDSKRSPKRAHTVPYAVGYLIEELAKQYSY